MHLKTFFKSLKQTKNQNKTNLKQKQNKTARENIITHARTMQGPYIISLLFLCSEKYHFHAKKATRFLVRINCSINLKIKMRCAH